MRVCSWGCWMDAKRWSFVIMSNTSYKFGRFSARHIFLLLLFSINLNKSLQTFIIIPLVDSRNRRINVDKFMVVFYQRNLLSWSQRSSIRQDTLFLLWWLQNETNAVVRLSLSFSFSLLPIQQSGRVLFCHSHAWLIKKNRHAACSIIVSTKFSPNSKQVSTIERLHIQSGLWKSVHYTEVSTIERCPLCRGSVPAKIAPSDR